MSRRTAVIVAAGVLAVLAAVWALGQKEERALRAEQRAMPTEDEMADAVGSPIMRHVYRGHVPGRSGEIMLVPKPHRYLIGEWDLTTLGTDTPEMYTSHPNPWDYLARVPLVFYGPAYMNRGEQVDRVVDIADIAPTYAALLGMNGFEADGEVAREVVPRRAVRPPKIIVTVVIDGGGWNALQAHPATHPAFDALARRGTLYTNATIGSAPSITGALHATFGSGIYPLRSGIPGNQMRGPKGGDTPDDPRIDTWLQNADPRYMRVPTVSELWDESTRNRALVGTVSYEGWHLGMIGHGAQRPSGDKDVAVLWEHDEQEWWINEDFYRIPRYVQRFDLQRLERYEEQLDARDGIVDGLWFGRTLEELQDKPKRPGTPAFARLTGDVIMDVLRREPFGRDGVTDLFWVEMKQPDFGGHVWNVERSEQGDTILEVDRQLARIKRWLDRAVGEGEYVLTVTADHGQEPLPDDRGGWRVNSQELQRDINARFGEGIIEVVSPVDMYVASDRARSRDVDLSDIARFVGAYTIGDNIPPGAPGSERVPRARLDETLFAGAFSTDYIAALTPQKIASFGPSDYPEGQITTPPGS
ncbi:MAG: alkaline phosphatase family protein [Actinomycetota bacterium]